MEEKWMGTAYDFPDQLTEQALAAWGSMEFYESAVRERSERNATAPKVGEPAADFALQQLNADGTLGEEFKLSAHRGRPVAIAFGSYTATPFRAAVPRLNELYDQYKDRVDFACAYIREAHPNDGWQVDINVELGIVYDEPTTIEERAAIAHDFVQALGLRIPLLIDTADNQVDDLYAGTPLRLYLVDAQGNVAFRTVCGSPGWDLKGWEAAITELVGN